jgi:hypothetical protein
MATRDGLAASLNTRGKYTATVERFGVKPSYNSYPIPTILLVDVRDAKGDPVCDHVWFTVGKRLDELCLSPGDTISFNARVTQYVKGYMGYRDDIYAPIEVDYRLSYPTKITFT